MSSFSVDRGVLHGSCAACDICEPERANEAGRASVEQVPAALRPRSADGVRPWTRPIRTAARTGEMFIAALLPRLISATTIMYLRLSPRVFPLCAAMPSPARFSLEPLPVVFRAGSKDPAVKTGTEAGRTGSAFLQGLWQDHTIQTPAAPTHSESIYSVRTDTAMRAHRLRVWPFIIFVIPLFAKRRIGRFRQRENTFSLHASGQRHARKIKKHGGKIGIENHLIADRPGKIKKGKSGI
jgi:hypothetical protein